VKKLLIRAALAALFLGIAAAAALGVGIYIITSDLPDVTALHDYTPLLTSRVYSREGVLMAELKTEHRYQIDPAELPDHVRLAFLAAEDSSFYEHRGIDFMGMLRAAWANLRAGRVVQGGSTITQQVAKRLMLTPEKTFKRKFKELALALRIEKALSKDHILSLYLNDIYLGHRAYGIEAAARVYFGVNAKDLSPAQAALLAGLPKAPSHYDPYRHPERALIRRAYVLTRMGDEEWLSPEALARAEASPLELPGYDDPFYTVAPYFTEQVRRELDERYGSELLLGGGLAITTTMDIDLQRAAQRALKSGIERVDRKMGYRGPLATHPLEAPFPETFTTPDGKKPLKEGSTAEGLITGVDGETLTLLAKGLTNELTVAELKWTLAKGQTLGDVFTAGDVVGVRFVAVELTAEELKAWELEREELRAAKLAADLAAKLAAKLENAAVLPTGDMAGLEEVFGGDKAVKDVEKVLLPPVKLLPTLYQKPQLEGALICLNANTGEVLASVGGYRYSVQNQFNRAVQARRQAGSAIKPLIYAAALESGMTPATVVYDSPIVYESADLDEKWKPNNYSQKFYGATTLREALIKSRNVVTIKVLQDMGIPHAVRFLRKAGITSRISPDLSMALGASDVTALELASVYGIFATGGMRYEPFFTQTIKDHKGDLLTDVDALPQNDPDSAAAAAEAVAGETAVETVQGAADKAGAPPAEKSAAELATDESLEPELEPEPEPVHEPAIDPRTAYLINYMMQSVITEGTGRRARGLDVPSAGKTGTTNDMRDAWFSGFTPDLITTVWVGYDDGRSMGKGQTGGSVAAPIWKDFMDTATKKWRGGHFPVPQGIEYARIDADTGELAGPGSKRSFQGAFIAGTAPQFREIALEPPYGGQWSVQEGDEPVTLDADEPGAMDALQ
jgi:penicillin-binding protein 1A